ncbi:LGFP repeat-containing protein [Corynebacterium variabile]
MLAVVLALGVSSTLSPTSAAQPSITTGPDDSASARANAEQEAIDNAAQAAATPAAGREDLEPAEPGFDDNTIDNDAGADWHATTNPEATIIPGQMRSDTEDIPGGFTKEEADRAEVQEAAEQQAQQDRATNPLARALAAAPVNCTTYWPSPYKVCGAIREKYDAIGGPTSFLTWPKSDELGVPDGVGRRNEFVNGFIYWHPTTGAHPVTTHFSTVWARNGWEAGRLGYPTTDELGLSDGIGRKQSFQRGHIYGSLAGLASIEGLIYDKWVTTGAEGGPLGYPTADEAGTPDGVGRFNRFAGGMLYWHPTHGAHPVTGAVLDKWARRGYETSGYGYPISDSFIDEEGMQVQEFEGGTLIANPDDVLSPFSCVAAALRVAGEMNLVSDFQYICSSFGVWVQENSDTPAVFSRPAAEDRTADQEDQATQAPQLRAEGPTGIECDWTEPTSISDPRRQDAYRISKSVDMCIGDGNMGNGKINWSREFAWNIRNTLTQRQNHHVALKVTSLGLPSGKFTVDFRVREDVSKRPDRTVDSRSVSVSSAGGKESSQMYLTSTDKGKYFVEVTNMELSIPSWDYKASYGGLTFAMGRYNCPQYRYESDLCTFPENIDDHTGVRS